METPFRPSRPPRDHFVHLVSGTRHILILFWTLLAGFRAKVVFRYMASKRLSTVTSQYRDIHLRGLQGPYRVSGSLPLCPSPPSSPFSSLSSPLLPFLFSLALLVGIPAPDYTLHYVPAHLADPPHNTSPYSRTPWFRLWHPDDPSKSVCYASLSCSVLGPLPLAHG